MATVVGAVFDGTLEMLAGEVAGSVHDGSRGGMGDVLGADCGGRGKHVTTINGTVCIAVLGGLASEICGLGRVESTVVN